jgi:hypothetical protein
MSYALILCYIVKVQNPRILETQIPNAPIALFVYRRTSLVRKVIEALVLNKEALNSNLTVFSDGAKGNGDESDVIVMRKYLSTITGFNSVTVITRDENLGLAESFIQGISEMLQANNCAIFIEEDNLVSSTFLSYMNSALRFYEHEKKVICVTGYSFPIKKLGKKGYFMKGAQTWTMGTWASKWELFNSDSVQLMNLVNSKNLKQQLNLYGTNYYSMLSRQIEGKIDSWGVRWMVSAIYENMYCFYPPIAYCRNIGNTLYATHARSDDLLLLNNQKLATKVNFKFPNFHKKFIIKPIYFKLMWKYLSIKHRIILFFNIRSN